MEILPDKVQSPLRKLRKSLKRLPKNPSVEGVHSLRTRARRVEAVSSALMKDHKKQTRAMLKTVKPLRKAAGQVRDMDVLIANVLTLSREEKQSESMVRLVEHLSKMRTESEQKLLDVVASKKKSASRHLRRFSKNAGKWLEDQAALGEETSSAATALLAELSRWPKFNRNNVHPFRIKVKELHYTLQLSPHADGRLVAMLEKVKDRIGDWHDWQELGLIAAGVLDPRGDRPLLAQIKETAERKLTLAFDAANGLRRRYLSKREATPKAKPAPAAAPIIRTRIVRPAPAAATVVQPNGQPAAAVPAQG